MNFEELKGKTLSKITGQEGDDQINFITQDGEHYRLYHEQDCCEGVAVEDICGDLNDLIGSPITMAEEVSHQDETPEGVTPPENPESYTWTFYKLATARGYVTIRWLGESNGYYSESVTFAKI